MEKLTEKEIEILLKALSFYEDAKGLKESLNGTIPDFIENLLPKDLKKDFNDFIKKEKDDLNKRIEECAFLKVKLFNMKKEIDFKKLESL